MSIVMVILSILVLFHILFLWSWLKDDFSVIDIGWGLAAFVMMLTFWVEGHFSFPYMRQNIVAIMVTAWAFRLSVYLWIRYRSVGEDFRYRNWRLEWQPHHHRIAYLRIFMLQATLAFFVFTPLLLVLMPGEQSGWGGVTDYIAIIVWTMGFIIESLADYQKSVFKKRQQLGLEPHKICRKGLWNYSRHPNYFGEACLWWGIFFFSFATPYWPFAWLGAFFLNFLLLKVSGIPFLEEKKKHDPDYQRYMTETSRFIPWFKSIQAKQSH